MSSLGAAEALSCKGRDDMEFARILGTSLRASLVGLRIRAIGGRMWGQESCRCSGHSFLALTGRAFLGDGRSPPPRASGRCRLLLVVGFGLPAILTPFTSVFAATLTTLDVEAYGAPPGFLNADLPRYLAQQMAEARLADWRFEPIAGHGGPPNRVE